MRYLFIIGVIFMILADMFVVDSQITNLTIGLLLKDNDKVTKNVVDLAVQLANKELIKENYRLQINTELVNENASFYVIRKACDLLKNRLVAIISRIGGVSSRHISSLCAKFHIPHIVTNFRYPDSMDTYAMDVRIVPDYNQYANIIYQYISKVENWNNMVIIHSALEGILKFENLVNQYDSVLKMRAWIHHDPKRNKILMKELSRSRNHFHFVVDIPYWQIMEFLIMASVHNLTSPQYSFIFTDLDASLVDIAAFKINNLVNITAFSIVNQSHIADLKSLGSDVDMKLRQIILAEVSSKRADLIPEFMTRPAMLFDSVTVVARGLLKLARSRKIEVTPLSCSKNDKWQLGASLINAITSSDDIYGTTGKIVFNDKIFRKEYNLTVLELTENGFIQSAYWSDDQIIVIPKTITPTIPLNITLQQPLRVTTKIEPPFVFYYDPDVKSNFDPDPSSWRGYCIELLAMIANDLKLNFTIHVVADNSYGMSVANETNPDGSPKWTGMIGELLTNKADLVVAPMTITYEREKVVDFTTPFMSLGLSIVFLRPRPEPPGLFSFLSPLSAKVWVYVIGAYVGVGILLFLISRITPYEWLPSNPCNELSTTENQFELLNSLWFAVGALVRQGCDQPPHASSTRVIAGAWWFFTLIIISTYTANLAAFLTVNMLILPIKNAEDLADQHDIKYGTIRGGSSFAFFEKAVIPTYKKMYSFMQANPDVLQNDVKKGIDRVLNSNGKYAFLMESSWIDYYVQRFCPLMRVGDLLDSKGYGIAFPEKSPLRDLISESILKLQKDQYLNTLKHKWWNEMNITEPCNIVEQGSIPPLDVHRVGGAFILLGVGFIVGLIIAIIEQLVRYRQTNMRNKISFLHFMLMELKFAMRFKSSSKKLKLTENAKTKIGRNLYLLDNAGCHANNDPSDGNLVRILEKVSHSPYYRPRPKDTIAQGHSNSLGYIGEFEDLQHFSNSLENDHK